LAVARQLPVISQQHTCSFSKGLKEKQKQEAAAMMVVEDDTDLVELTRKYDERILYCKGDKKTWRVCGVQYDERKIRGEKKRYYEATVVEVFKGVGGWDIPDCSYVEVEGRKEIKDSKQEGFYLLDVTDPDSPVALPDVDEMAQAHETREARRERDSQVGASPVGGGSNPPKRARK
jgi:hypothetical protein